MNFEEYKLIMQTQYDLLEGLYFDSEIKKDSYNIYKSDIITDNFWNIATLNKEYVFDDASNLADIEQHFKNISRKPCIYIPRILNKYTDYRNYLIDNGYEVNDIDAYMAFTGSDKNIEIINKIEKVKTNKQYDDFMEVLQSAYSGEITEENPYAGSITGEYYKAIKKSLSNDQFSHFVLYKNGDPASVATLSHRNGYGSINNVGTKNKYQNLGLGKQIMKQCVDEFNKLGGKTLFLFTEHKSKNEQWYTRQGFETMFINEQYVKNV